METEGSADGVPCSILDAVGALLSPAVRGLLSSCVGNLLVGLLGLMMGDSVVGVLLGLLKGFCCVPKLANWSAQRCSAS